MLTLLELRREQGLGFGETQIELHTVAHLNLTYHSLRPFQVDLCEPYPHFGVTFSLIAMIA